MPGVRDGIERPARVLARPTETSSDHLDLAERRLLTRQPRTCADHARIGSCACCASRSLPHAQLVRFGIMSAEGNPAGPAIAATSWRAISQALPPGTAATAMRDVVYFHGYGATRRHLRWPAPLTTRPGERSAAAGRYAGPSAPPGSPHTTEAIQKADRDTPRIAITPAMASSDRSRLPGLRAGRRRQRGLRPPTAQVTPLRETRGVPPRYLPPPAGETPAVGRTDDLSGCLRAGCATGNVRLCGRQGGDADRYGAGSSVPACRRPAGLLLVQILPVDSASAGGRISCRHRRAG